MEVHGVPGVPGVSGVSGGTEPGETTEAVPGDAVEPAPSVLPLALSKMASLPAPSPRHDGSMDASAPATAPARHDGCMDASAPATAPAAAASGGGGGKVRCSSEAAVKAAALAAGATAVGLMPLGGSHASARGNGVAAGVVFGGAVLGGLGAVLAPLVLTTGRLAEPDGCPADSRARAVCGRAFSFFAASAAACATSTNLEPGV